MCVWRGGLLLARYIQNVKYLLLVTSIFLRLKSDEYMEEAGENFGL